LNNLIHIQTYKHLTTDYGVQIYLIGDQKVLRSCDCLSDFIFSTHEL